jgi:hypothetical protein
VKKMREHAHCLQVYRRDRENRGLGGGEGEFEPVETLRFAHAYFERHDSIIPATDWLPAQTRAMRLSASKGPGRHEIQRIQARESEAWRPNSPLHPRKPRGALGDDSRRSREETRDGAPQIELIDGEQTCELLKDLKLGIRTEIVENVSVAPEVFREFEPSS